MDLNLNFKVQRWEKYYLKIETNIDFTKKDTFEFNSIIIKA